MSAYAATTLLLGADMVPHAAQAIALRRMLPGLAGGLTVSLPCSALVVGLDADADDHLVKPFSFAELGAVMSRYERQV